MNLKDKIIIKDWIGRVLFEGHYNDSDVLRIMELNKDEDGLLEDISVYWLDENDKRNVWEHIDF